MNPDDLQSLWNSRANQPSPSDAAQLKTQLVRRLKKRRALEIAWFVWTMILLLASTVLAARVFMSDRFSFASEWTAIPLLILPWICALFFLRNFRNRRGSLIAADQSIANAIRAALAENRSRKIHSKAIGVLLFATSLILPFVIAQLEKVGKTSSREALSMAVFFGSVLLASAVFVTVQYFRKLRPEGERLTALLGDYDSSGA